MFIQEVISNIKEPYTLQFNETRKKVDQLDTDELFELTLKDIQDMVKVPVIPYEGLDFKVTMLSTTGCPHWIEQGKFTGCAMCNHINNYIDGLASLFVLKKRDLQLYAKALRYSFDLQRGENPESVPNETVTGYDTLNPEEIPEEIFNELFAKGNLFKVQPHQYEFETRASSVNHERIKKIKNILGNRFSLEIGVEVHDNWIRNNWLNKNISNRQIETAIRLLKKEDLRVSADLLIGIPGLTHAQSIKLFFESVDWLESLGVDIIICTPVAKLERTLQSFIYDQLHQNRQLKELGIINGKQTAIFWVFAVFDSLYQIYREKPSLIKKLNLSSINFYHYLRCWKKEALNRTTLNILEAVKEFYISRDLAVFQDVIALLKKDRNYQDYKELLKSQKGLDGLMDTIVIVAGEIARKLWPEKWQTKMKGFEKELISYERTVKGLKH